MSPSEAYLKARKAEKSQAREAEKPKDIDINSHLKTRRLRGSPDAILKASQAADRAIETFYHETELELKSGESITVEVQRIDSAHLLRATNQPYLQWGMDNQGKSIEERSDSESISNFGLVLGSLFEEKGQMLKGIVCQAVVSLRLVLHTLDECADINADLERRYESNPEALNTLAEQYQTDPETAIASQKVYSIDLFSESGILRVYEFLFGLTVPESEVEAVDSFRDNGTGQSEPSESIGTGNESEKPDVSIDAAAV